MMNILIGKKSVLVDIHDKVKYERGSEVIHSIKYEGVKGFEVVSDPDEAAKIEAESDGTCIDDYHEYLVIYFENGEISTFRNSYVDMFHI